MDVSPPFAMLAIIGVNHPIQRTSIVFEERCPLAIIGQGGLPCIPELPSKNAWKGNDQGTKKQNSRNGDGEDPLQGDDLSQELADSQRSGKNAEFKPHGLVLVCDQEE
jgi:hypothetical protein